MKHLLKHASLFIAILLISTSCSLLGIQSSKKTDASGNIYPKFTQKDSVRGALNPMRTCYDVQHYTLSIDINPTKKYIKGFVDMDFKVMSPTNTIQVDLFKNMKMDSIIFEGKKVSFTRKYNAVYLLLPSLKTGEQKSIRCYYQGKPIVAPRPPWEGGFVWKQSADKSPWIGVACEVVGASLWWPCKDHLTDEPDKGVIMNVSVPGGLTVISNGIQKSHETKDGKEYFTWETKYPINNYNVTVYIGKYEHFSEEYKGIDTTFTLDYYMLPENLEKAKEVFKQTPNIIRFYENTYGPYPWPREGYKLVGSPFEGMEHQTAIAYGTGFHTHYLGFDYIILHESAHEWWGNSISVGDVSDIFMHEGFATFSEVLFVEKTYGKDNADKYIATYANYVKNKNPVVGPRDVNFWDYEDTDPYMKGAWALQGLRFVIDNDSLFFDILKTYYNKSKYSIVSVKDFTDFVNAKTNQDLSWYYNQYLYDRRCPSLEYIATQDGKTVTIEMRWSNVNSDFVLPVELKVNGDPIRVSVSTTVQKYVFHNAEELYFNPYVAYYSIQKVKSFNK
jgi:aminopeptidase N